MIDDFLTNGCALIGRIDLVESAGATVEGMSIAVKKEWTHFRASP